MIRPNVFLEDAITTCPTNAQERFCGVMCAKADSAMSAEILTTYAEHFAGRGHGGWRAIGEILGVSGGMAYEIAHGQRSATHEQALRWRVFQETIGSDNPNVRIVQTVTCPSCGQLHQVPDCHGQLGEVAIIPALPSPDVKPQPRHKQPDYWRPCLSPDLKGDMTNEDVEIAVSLYRAMKTAT